MKNKERKYIAYGDTGRDYIEWVFYSTRRANSKANKEDAARTYKKQHGYSPKVMRTERTEQN